MSGGTKIIPIIIAILLSVLTVYLIDFIWRESNGEVVSTLSFVEHNSPWVMLVKNPLPKVEMFATWYDYSLKDAPGYSLTHATAASRTYPRETQLLVCMDKCVQVRVNDWVENPNVEIDLSSFAFSQIAPLYLGIVKVSITPLQ